MSDENELKMREDQLNKLIPRIEKTLAEFGESKRPEAVFCILF